MKITIVQGAFLPVPPALGGAIEKMWFALGKEFASKGHQVTHISRKFGQFPSEEFIGKVHHKRVKGYATPSNKFYLKWLDFLYSIKAKTKIPRDSDIVITNTFWMPVIVNATIRRKCFVDVQRIPKGQMSLYNKAGILRANSNVVVKAIQKEISQDLWKKIVMIPNPLPFDICSQVDIKRKEKILLYAGRIHPEKGIDLLIMAFKMAKITWTLQIVGPYDVAAGGGGEAYYHSLKAMAAESQIDFIGPVYDTNSLNEYYRRASVFVYPSIAEQGETFGLAPLEAMAWGCVPVISSLDCFKDFVTNELNGLIFDHRAANSLRNLCNSILKLTENKDLILALATKAMEVQQSHSTSMISSSFLTTFQNMISYQTQLAGIEGNV